MPSAPSKVQVSTHSTGANEKHQDHSCRNYNYPLQLGDDFSTFPVGNVSLKSRPNKQYKKHQLSQCPQVLIGEKLQISSCIKEELCKAVKPMYGPWSSRDSFSSPGELSVPSPAWLLRGSATTHGHIWAYSKGFPLLQLTHTQCKAEQRSECVLGHLQGRPVAKGDIPTNIVLDFMDGSKSDMQETSLRISLFSRAQAGKTLHLYQIIKRRF